MEGIMIEKCKERVVLIFWIRESFLEMVKFKLEFKLMNRNQLIKEGRMLGKEKQLEKNNLSIKKNICKDLERRRRVFYLISWRKFSIR